MFYLSRGEQVALFALLCLLLAGAGLYTYARGRHGAAERGEQPLFVPAPEAAGSREVLVHVSGSVAAPGLYRLPEGSRVVDALEQAGGATAQADMDAVNLAAAVRDGDKLYVPAEGEAIHPPARTGGRGLISLSDATPEELERLPGIGPVYARRIVSYREAKKEREGHGFESVDELLNVDGIGPRRLAAIRDLVCR